MAKRIDAATLHRGSGYPASYDVPCALRERRPLAEAAGPTKIGVTLLRLPPAAWSTQRHWHINNGEFVYVLSGEVTLGTDHGEETLRTGDSAGFRAGDPNGRHLQNRSGADALVLEIGNHLTSDTANYPDFDLIASLVDGKTVVTHRHGTPY